MKKINIALRLLIPMAVILPFFLNYWIASKWTWAHGVVATFLFNILILAFGVILSIFASFIIKGMWEELSIMLPMFRFHLAKITPSSLITEEWIESEDNAEVRSMLIHRARPEVLQHVGRLKDEEGTYKLVEFSTNRRGLLMTNPSTGSIHLEWVPPRTPSVKEALEFRNNSSLRPEIIT